jgi:dihydropteroate synthase
MLQFGLPILCGASRKGFLGRTLAQLHDGQSPSPEARLHATTAANVAAILAGAHLLRVHDVRPAREAAAIADAILAAAAEFTANTGPAFARTVSSTPQ